jgi:predicted AAA+ superfamily ATPase
MNLYRDAYAGLLSHADRAEMSVLLGARQIGKSTLMRQLFVTLKERGELVDFLSLEDPQILQLFNEHPGNLFEATAPPSLEKRAVIFIDEIQYLNDPSNFLKYNYDRWGDRLKLIVSGSSSFYIDEHFSDSLAGRKRMFELQTLTFEEMLHFTGRDELIPYAGGAKVPLSRRPMLNEALNEYLCFGGYPAVVLAPTPEEKVLLIQEIATSYVKKDALEAGVKRPDQYLMLAKVLAAQTGQMVNMQELGRELAMNNQTVDAYVRLLRQSFHVSFCRPFHRSLVKELRKMPKLFFNDLGLRNWFCGSFQPPRLREDKGALFENFVFRRLLEVVGGDAIHFWRTQQQHEVDFVVTPMLGEPFALEVKWDSSRAKPSKYRPFQDTYPDIPLSFVDLETVFGLFSKSASP